VGIHMEDALATDARHAGFWYACAGALPWNCAPHCPGKCIRCAIHFVLVAYLRRVRCPQLTSPHAVRHSEHVSLCRTCPCVAARAGWGGRGGLEGASAGRAAGQ